MGAPADITGREAADQAIAPVLAGDHANPQVPVAHEVEVFAHAADGVEQFTPKHRRRWQRRPDVHHRPEQQVGLDERQCRLLLRIEARRRREHDALVIEQLEVQSRVVHQRDLGFERGRREHVVAVQHPQEAPPRLSQPLIGVPRLAQPRRREDVPRRSAGASGVGRDRRANQRPVVFHSRVIGDDELERSERLLFQAAQRFAKECRPSVRRDDDREGDAVGYRG